MFFLNSLSDVVSAPSDVRKQNVSSLFCLQLEGYPLGVGTVAGGRKGFHTFSLAMRGEDSFSPLLFPVLVNPRLRGTEPEKPGYGEGFDTETL